MYLNPNSHACSQAQKQMKMNSLMPHAYLHPNGHACTAGLNPLTLFYNIFLNFETIIFTYIVIYGAVFISFAPSRFPLTKICF
jgi:hypothetical protein